MMFITGATGVLGRHLQRSASIEDRWELIAPGSGALDVRERDAVLHMISSWKPKAIVHLAYRKDDRRSIVDASRHVAEAAAACGARLIHVSTDVVFPGRPAAYRESDPVFPITDYGRMKADAEIEVMAHCPTAVVVRTSLLYGSNPLGHVQLDVQRALRGELTMTFFTDEYRCPAHAADVAAAIGVLASMPLVTGPLHVAGPDAISRADFAIAIARWLGSNPALLRTSTMADAGVDRPAHLVLDSSKAASLGLRCRSIGEALR